MPRYILDTDTVTRQQTGRPSFILNLQCHLPGWGLFAPKCKRGPDQRFEVERVAVLCFGCVRGLWALVFGIIHCDLERLSPPLDQKAGLLTKVP